MLMHLCWKERSNNNPEDDLVIFPDEIEFKKVTQNTTGNTDGFRSSNRTDLMAFFRSSLHSEMAQQRTEIILLDARIQG
jgi:26S proteasome regulatory subunit N13